MASLPLYLLILILLGGLLFVILGSDFLVDGSSDIARRSGLSEFVIGLTIVGIGTSTPEMVVSWIGAIKGNSDIAIGNIIGSNIFNTFMILGLTALILPINITKENLRRDIPVNIFVTLVFILIGLSNYALGIGTDRIGREAGIIFLLLFAFYMYICFRAKNDVQQDEADNKVTRPLWLSILLIAGGLAMLIAGGRYFVDSACEIAHRANLSDKFIGITILAFGTSLPELATCVVAAIKKKGALALGNILGSNIANILLIIGGAATIHPLAMNHISSVDAGFLVLSTLFILASYFTFDRHRLDRMEGVVMLFLFGGYMYLLINAL